MRGKEYVGFWNTFIMDHQLPTEIKIGRYDLDEKTGELRSDKDNYQGRSHFT